jgi:hypothetical protein
MRFLVFLFALAFATPAAADRFALGYDGAGLGLVPLGELRIDADISADSYDVRASIVSGGLLNLFERTRIQVSSSGLIENGVVRWRRYDLDHHYSHKHRAIAMHVGDDGAVNAEVIPNYRLWGDPPTSEQQRRAARDPLSTMVAMAIDVGQNRRCSGAYATFDGRFYYLLELAGGEIDDFRGGGYEGQVLKCALAYIAVAGFEARDAGRRRIPHGSVWFALPPNTTFAPPVRIATPISAGGAVIRLSSWNRANVEIQTTDSTP